MQLLEPGQIFHTQSMLAKSGRTNRANIHIPVKKHSKQCDRIPPKIAIGLQLDIVSWQKNKETKSDDTPV